MSQSSFECDPIGERYTLVIHGGAGTITRKPGEAGRLDEEMYKAALLDSLRQGQAVLAARGTALVAPMHESSD